MEKLALKKKVLDAGIKAQGAIIQDFKDRIAELKRSGEQYADEQHDSGAQSMTQETEDQVSLLSDQLQMLLEEMEKLERIETNEAHDVVHLGSIVITDKFKFFVSVSIERFKAGDEEYFGVSTLAPIYKAMEGKKAGESFEVNGNRFLITDLF
jgi:hypothetical protein